jgi:regulator of replication initiation timing
LVVAPETAVVGEISELRASLDREVAAIVTALSGPASAPGDDDPARQLAEHGELMRQLSALSERVARARSQIRDPGELRAELATLLFFARTLRADAEMIRARLREALEQLAREQAAERLRRQRMAAEREAVLRRRDALRAKIGQTAERIAQGDRNECRGTVPVIRLGEGVTVCSMAVASPKRLFRARDFWLVTLTECGDDVLIRRA